MIFIVSVVTLTTSSGNLYGNFGNTITFTCNFDNEPNAVSVTPQLYKDGIPLNTASSGIHVINSLSLSDNGSYSCHVTYTDSLGRNHTYSNVTREFYVRQVTVTPEVAYTITGESVNFTCKTVGDANTVSWTGDDNSPTVSGNTILISTATNPANYTCSVTWTDGGAVDTSEVELVVLEYPQVDGDERQEVGEDAQIFCVFEILGGLSHTISW
eukprot:sb/3470117/